MTTPLASVVIDCADPRKLARFWLDITGYALRSDEDDWASIHPPEGGVFIAFQRVPEAKSGKNRVHVDLAATDVEAEVGRIQALGAHRLWDSDDPKDVFVVLADPEGNEFCIVARSSSSPEG